MPKPTPDPAVIASIEHLSEKLGYLLSQVEVIFQARAQEERHQVTLQHTIAGGMLMKEWMAGKVQDDEYYAVASELLESTTVTMEGLRMTHEENLARLHQIVTEAMARGKAQYGNLDYNLEQILNTPES